MSHPTIDVFDRWATERNIRVSIAHDQHMGTHWGWTVFLGWQINGFYCSARGRGTGLVEAMTDAWASVPDEMKGNA